MSHCLCEQQWKAPHFHKPQRRNLNTFEEPKTIHSRAWVQQSQWTPRTRWGEFEVSKILAEWTVPEPNSVSAISYFDSFYPRLGKCSSNSSSSFQSTTIHMISSELHINPVRVHRTGISIIQFLHQVTETS